MTKCLFSRAMAQAHPEVGQSWQGADGDENHDKSLVCAIVDVLPAPQPRPAQTTPVQDMSKGALDQFRLVAHRLLAYT